MGNSWETFPCLTRDLLMPQDCHSLTEIPQRLHNVWCMKMPIRLPSGFFFPRQVAYGSEGLPPSAFSFPEVLSNPCHPEDPGGQLELCPIQGSSSCIPEPRTCCCLALLGLSTVTSIVLEGPSMSS